MGRMYIVNHWNDAAAYSGEQIGDRLKDSTALHFNRDGSANVELYSEETALAKKKTSISIEDRILPQAKRIRVLTEQLIELESERKAGMSIEKYSKLRDILICKRDRAQVLYEKAVSVKPVAKTDDEYDESQPHTTPSKASQHTHFPEQIATFSSNKACTSAVQDAILFITGSVVLLIGFLVFF